MTAAPAQAPARPLRAGRPRPVLPGRLLRLELRRNAMLWVLPVAAALFWLITYRKSMALPPLWNVRAMSMQSSALAVFVSPTVGAAAWMGSREGRHGMTDLVAGTARPRWARQLATWAATTCWAMVAYVGCVGVLYAVTARQAAWGGPLWWPAAVGAASLPAFSAVGFVAGTVFPSRFTAPLVAVAAFVGLAFSTLPIRGSQSYWQVSPVVAGAWDFGPNESVGTFYHYLPDLPIAQVMFAAGLTAAVLGGLGLRAGSGGRWLRRSAAAITAAGLPGAPVRISQAATTYRQGSGNDISSGMAGPSMSGRPPRFHLVLPDQLLGPTMTTSELAAEIRSNVGQDILADVIGVGPGASPAQQAVMAALLKGAAVPQSASSAPGTRQPNTASQLPAPVRSAARRFAALPAAVRHAWLTQHLAALRAGRVSLAQLP